MKLGAYFQRYKQGAKIKPRVWAWHAYAVVIFGESFSQATPQRFARFVNGTRAQRGKDSADDPRIWVTEVGPSVAVKLNRQQDRREPLDRPKAEAEVVPKLEKALMEIPKYPRVDRIYLYNWAGSSSYPGSDGKQVIPFDTGLTSAYEPKSLPTLPGARCGNPKDCFASRQVYDVAKSATASP